MIFSNTTADRGKGFHEKGDNHCQLIGCNFIKLFTRCTERDYNFRTRGRSMEINTAELQVIAVHVIEFENENHRLRVCP